jgi:hypothetical protein
MMKPAGLLPFLILALALPAAAQTSPPAVDRIAKSSSEDPPKLSPSTSQLLTDKLPKYAPPAPPKPVVDKPNPDVLELPKMTITQKKRPRLNEEVMMTNKAFNEKLAKEKLSSFDRDFLNKFTLPSWFGGVSAADRAREEYNREKYDELTKDVLQMAKVTEVVDPAQAKAMRDAVNKP